MLTTLWISLVLAQPCVDGVCPPRGAAPVSETPHPAVVRIANTGPRERVYGSGTLVAARGDRGLVLSCAHLFREFTGTLQVTFATGSSVPARVLLVDTQHDLSALEISLPSARPVTVARHAPRVGDPLVSCGYGPHGQFAANRGRALGYVSLRGNQRDVLELTGSARQGDSGGPIFNARGELAGVLFGTDGQRVDGTHCLIVGEFLKRTWAGAKAEPANVEPAVPARAGDANEEVRNKPTLPPAPVDNTVALQVRLSRLESETEQLRAQLAEMLKDLERSRADAAEPTREPDSTRRSGGGASWAIEALLKARLTAVLVGVGLPGGAAAVVAWFIARRLRRRVQAVVIHDEARPLPQIVERERQFVEVQVPTGRLGALEWAMDEYVKRNPGARPTIETIEAYARQFQSATRQSA